MKKIILVLAVAIAVFVMGCEEIQTNGNKEAPDIKDIKKAEMTPELCEQTGGNWNECGSPCAGTDAEICIQVCQAQCECGGIAGFSCPEGYVCRLSGKVADEVGVCV